MSGRPLVYAHTKGSALYQRFINRYGRPLYLFSAIPGTLRLLADRTDVHFEPDTHRPYIGIDSTIVSVAIRADLNIGSPQGIVFRLSPDDGANALRARSVYRLTDRNQVARMALKGAFDPGFGANRIDGSYYKIPAAVDILMTDPLNGDGLPDPNGARLFFIGVHNRNRLAMTYRDNRLDLTQYFETTQELPLSEQVRFEPQDLRTWQTLPDHDLQAAQERLDAAVINPGIIEERYQDQQSQERRQEQEAPRSERDLDEDLGLNDDLDDRYDLEDEPDMTEDLLSGIREDGDTAFPVEDPGTAEEPDDRDLGQPADEPDAVLDEVDLDQEEDRTPDAAQPAAPQVEPSAEAAPAPESRTKAAPRAKRAAPAKVRAHKGATQHHTSRSIQQARNRSNARKASASDRIARQVERMQQHADQHDDQKE